MEQRHSGPRQGGGRSFNRSGGTRFARPHGGGASRGPHDGARHSGSAGGGAHTASSSYHRGASATPSSGGAHRSYSSGGHTPSYGGSTRRPYQGSNPRSGGSYAGSRGSFSGGGRGGYRGSASRGGQGGRGGSGFRNSQGEYIDPARYINKAVITEEVEHFVPEHAFDDFKIEPALKQSIKRKGFSTPTPIQDRSIPHVLQGVDVVGIANTGTGKTGAFLIPLINKVIVDPRESVLIIVPTRELATQIDEELKGFIHGSSIRSVCVFGGANINRHIEALKSHRHFVIGTPGRLKDLMQRKRLNLASFKTVVLDEADRMLDMGFVHDMRFIIGAMSKERQTLFYSATLSSEIEKLIGEFLNEPVRISVKTRDTSKNIDQDVVRIPRGGNKFDVLLDLLKKPDFTRTLVFGRTKHGVDKLSKQLLRAGITAESIHGNKNNSKRQLALRLFKEGKVKALIATDVAARGLDIPDVSHVINFDLPSTYDDYVHRIGRTGRAAKKGSALTLIEE